MCPSCRVLPHRDAFSEARLALAGAAGAQPSARSASVLTRGGCVAVEVQLQEMNVMSATLDEIQKQHQAIKTRVRPFFPLPLSETALAFALQRTRSAPALWAQ